MKSAAYLQVFRLPKMATLLLMLALGTGGLAAAGRFLPYSGTVSGTIRVALTPAGPVVTSDAVQTVSHLGRGPQVFTQVDLSGFLDGFVSPVVTLSQGFGANGDSLWILSTLWAQPVSADELVYEGRYEIVGGTGRFGWSYPSFDGDYGSGDIVGSARVEVTAAGEFLFVFSNSFEGTLQAPLNRRR